MTALANSLGRAPVANKTTSALSAISVPSLSLALTFSASMSSAVPANTFTPWESKRCWISELWVAAHFFNLALTSAISIVTSVACTPIAELPLVSIAASATAIRALLGTTSVSTAAPPMPSRSIRVTSAPNWDATKAAS